MRGSSVDVKGWKEEEPRDGGWECGMVGTPRGPGFGLLS